MDESSGKSAFSIGLTFRVRNRNLMRAFQPRFVIRAEWSKFVRAHPRRAAWKVKSLALREWGTGAAGSVSGLDTVEHEWSCRQVLRRASREFHSRKLRYSDRPEGIVLEWGGKRRLSTPSGRYYRAGCRGGRHRLPLHLEILCPPLLISFQRLQMGTCESSRVSWGIGFNWPQGSKCKLICINWLLLDSLSSWWYYMFIYDLALVLSYFGADPKILGWPKCASRFFDNSLWRPNGVFGQPDTLGGCNRSSVCKYFIPPPRRLHRNMHFFHPLLTHLSSHHLPSLRATDCTGA